MLVGDGALLEAVREQVTELGLEEAVTFAGYQQGRGVRALAAGAGRGVGPRPGERLEREGGGAGAGLWGAGGGGGGGRAAGAGGRAGGGADARGGGRGLAVGGEGRWWSTRANARIAEDVLALYEQARAER